MSQCVGACVQDLIWEQKEPRRGKLSSGSLELELVQGSIVAHPRWRSLSHCFTHRILAQHFGAPAGQNRAAKVQAL